MFEISVTHRRDIAKVTAYAFIKLSKRKGNQIIAMWPKHFKRLEQDPSGDI